MLGRISYGIIGAVTLLGTLAQASPVYFLAAEPAGSRVHGDSFVLPLTDPDDIAHARDLILRGPAAAQSPIVFAEIAKGVDGLNRDLLRPEQPDWSWHVTKFEGFGDFGIELLDGWPTYVEKHRDAWLAQTSGLPAGGPPPETGHIGFWSYTVVSELQGYPQVTPPISVIPLPPALATGAVTIGVIGVGMLGRRLRNRRA
jgi:hypothetical protein